MIIMPMCDQDQVDHSRWINSDLMKVVESWLSHLSVEARVNDDPPSIEMDSDALTNPRAKDRNF
jgi:hypothetical protein